MLNKTIEWVGKEFIELSGEARPAATAALEAAEIFRRFDDELKTYGLSLDNTVRSRLWARDRESRDIGSAERVRALSGKARSASSSYIAPGRFDTEARIAVDVIALRPSRTDLQKRITEYDPPIVPIRFLVYDNLVVLSGVTTVLPTLEQQFDNILPRITASLNDAGSSWNRVVRISFYLHRSQTIAKVKDLFSVHVQVPVPQQEYCFVDGYSSLGKLCEVEVTATI